MDAVMDAVMAEVMAVVMDVVIMDAVPWPDSAAGRSTFLARNAYRMCSVTRSKRRRRLGSSSQRANDAGG